MKTYTAIIIDDEVNALELLEASLKLLFPEIILSAKCSHWTEVIKLLKENSYDLMFLDISMPEKSGMDLLKLASKITSEIIFVTAHQEYAIEAFKFRAAAYVLKPYSDEELAEAVNIALARIEEKNPVRPRTTNGKLEIIGIPDTKSIDYIHLSDIIYFQAENKCTKIVLKDRVLYSSYHIGLFKNELNDSDFFEVHRSYLVNKNAVQRYIPKTSTIIMSNKNEIPLARSVKDIFLKSFLGITKH